MLKIIGTVILFYVLVVLIPALTVGMGRSYLYIADAIEKDQMTKDAEQNKLP